MASPYTSYKPSGVDWLGEIPSHWTIDRLKWSAEAPVNGIWGTEPDGDDDLACIRVADFDRQAFKVCRDEFTYRAIPQSDRRRRLLAAGDLLIEKSGGGEKQLVGAVVEWSGSVPAVTSNFIAKMTCLPGMVPRYWTYVHAHLYAGRVNYPAIKQTTGIQNLDSAAYLNERTAYPTEAEQVAIANFLDRETGRIDALVDKKRRLLELLEEKRLAVITNAVTKGLDPKAPMKDSDIDGLGQIPAHWEVVQIGKKIQLHRGVDITKDEQVDGPYPVVSSGGIASHHDQYLCEGPGVLVGRKGAAGKVHYVESNYWPHDTTLYTSQFRGNWPKFVYYKLLTMDLVSYDTGSSNPTINRNIVHPTKVSWPPVSEQRLIAEKLDRETNDMASISGKILGAIERLSEYRSALITNAVTGKIDVRSEVSKEAAA